MPETQYITLYAYCGEDDTGRAVYRARVYEAIYEEHTREGNGEDGYDIRYHISGFLFPGGCEYSGQNKIYGKIGISTAHDVLCAGDTSSFADPYDAARHGHRLYRVKSAAQPPRYADGMLSAWCHFEGQSRVRDMLK